MPKKKDVGWKKLHIKSKSIIGDKNINSFSSGINTTSRDTS